MKYGQRKAGQKLHLVYELPEGKVTNPICNIKTNGFRMIINVPLGNACKNCLKRLNSKKYNCNDFLRPYYNRLTKQN